MTIKARWWALVLLVGGTSWLLGCEQKRTESPAPQESSQESPGPTPPSGEPATSRGSRDGIAPAETIDGVLTQIDAEQGKIADAIQNGHLNRVHPLADGIAGLVVALTEKAAVSSPQTAPRLKILSEDVKVTASDLGKMGDAGNLKQTQIESAKFNAILSAVKATVKPGSVDSSLAK
ncbi:MAG TPA: hypothetical protein VJW75_05605 [Candidatus Eisenbacteria bacterium]|nr:hypothetical protein [Candidatus Eisenbacteria bacterium]